MNVQVDRERLKDTLQELLNEILGLKTQTATDSSTESTVNMSGMSSILTGPPPFGGEFSVKYYYLQASPRKLVPRMTMAANMGFAVKYLTENS